MIPFRRVSARRLSSGHRVYHMGASAGKRGAKAQKSQVCRPKTGRPDLSYKMHSDPPFKSDPSQAQGKKGGAPEKADSSPADGNVGRGRGRWRARNDTRVGAVATIAHARTAGRRRCNSAKVSGLPDLSYKMHSDPPFGKGGAPGKADSSPADGRPGMTMGGQVGKARRVAANGVSRRGQVRHFTMLTGCRLMTTSLF